MNDSDKRKQALDISKSFIIQAPAGSGKTELLIQRYLNLLAHCQNPEEVIAITFTNKAADELKQRVVENLKATKNKKPTTAHKIKTYELALKVIKNSKKNNWDILNNNQRLKITTIDSLAANIANKNSDISILSNKTVTDWRANILYEQAATETILEISNKKYKKAISDILLHLDNDAEKLKTLIANMLKKRDQWLRHLVSKKNFSIDIKNTLKQNSNKIITKKITELKIASANINPRFFELSKHSTLYKSNNYNLCEYWEFIANICLTSANSLRKSLNINSGFPPKIKAAKDELIEIIKSFNIEDDFIKLLIDFKYLPNENYSAVEFHILKQLTTILILAYAKLRLLFQAESSTDFMEINLNAIDTLGQYDNPSDIALFLDYKVNHILIDEFQDTSITHFNLIKKLVANWQINEAKTIFIVGDPMQSIYRFREAQVGLFLQVKKYGIADIKPKYLNLEANFRSTKSIVTANNRFFNKILAKKDDIDLGAVSFNKSIATNNIDNYKSVEFNAFAKNGDILEAQRVIEIIKTNIKANPKTEIAILVRSRNYLVSIIKTLDAEKVDYEAIEINKLKEHFVVNDLLSLSKALLNYNDKLAWLSILRAPWCGLKLKDILIIATHSKDTIWQIINDKNLIKKLSNDGLKRISFFINAINPAINYKGDFLFRELFINATNRLNIDSYLNNSAKQVKKLFIQKIYELEDDNLLDNTKYLELSLNNLYAPSNNSQVKVMTIHSAKGLEFDTIILPGLGKGKRSNNPDILKWMEYSDNNFIMAPIASADGLSNDKTYNYIKRIEKEKDSFETMRLLYVAMTRTRNKLYLLGNVNENNKVVSNSLLYFLKDFYSEEIAEVTAMNTKIAEKTILLKRVNEFIKSPEVIVQKELYKDINLDKDSLYKKIIGIVTHKFFEINANVDINTIKNELAANGMNNDNLDKASIEINSMLANTKNDVDGRWIFKKRDSTKVEAKFSYIKDGEIVTIIIDRMFIENNVLWIIDFKTSKPQQNENITDFINKQSERYFPQLQKYASALTLGYNYKIKTALYFPALPKFVIL